MVYVIQFTVLSNVTQDNTQIVLININIHNQLVVWYFCMLFFLNYFEFVICLQSGKWHQIPRVPVRKIAHRWRSSAELEALLAVQITISGPKAQVRKTRYINNDISHSFSFKKHGQKKKKNSKIRPLTLTVSLLARF